MDRLTILTCGGQLLAAKRWRADGTISEYDSAKYWTLATRRVRDVHELSALLRELEGKPQTCVIRGAPLPPDVWAIRDAAEFKPGKVRRSLEYFEDQPLHTMLVDVDKFHPTTCDALEDPQRAIDEFITTRLPDEFAGASYHWQLSNSAGHPTKGRELRAHLWFWLSKPATSAQLTVWAEHAGYMGDVAVFRTVQPHYTAAPVMDPGQHDPFPQRSGFVDGLAGDEVVLELDPEGLQPRVAERSRGERLRDLVSDDPIAQALGDQGMVRSQARDGALNIVCPFADEHSTGEGAETSTQYYPPHTGGFSEGAFKCLHGTCAHRTRGMFLEKLGLASDFSADEFDLGPQGDADSAVEAPVGEDGKPLKYVFQRLGDMISAKPQRWIIKGVLPRAQLGVIYGASGSGKSFVAFDMAMSIARGIEWRGKRTKATSVAYVVAEGSTGFPKRVQAYAQHYGIDPNSVNVRGLAAAPNLGEPADVAQLVRGIKAMGGVGLVIVDTLAQVTPGADENTSKDMNPIMKRCQAISEATGALVLLVHHSGKDAAKGARGWSGIRAALDVELEVVRHATGRCVRLTKSKDDVDGLEWGFELEVLTVGVDEDGDPTTSCVVREAEVPKAVVERKMGKVQRLLVEAFQTLAEAQTQGIEVEAVITEAMARTVVEPGRESKTRGNLRDTLRNMLNDPSFGIGKETDGTLYVC